MNSIGQQWQLAYAVIALLFAVSAIVAAHHLRVDEGPSAATESTLALVAGAIWPVMIVGLAQLWAVQRLMSRKQAGRQVPPQAVTEDTTTRELAGAH
mgnify:CR=1 FL=1